MTHFLHTDGGGRATDGFAKIFIFFLILSIVDWKSKAILALLSLLVFLETHLVYGMTEMERVQSLGLADLLDLLEYDSAFSVCPC